MHTKVQKLTIAISVLAVFFVLSLGCALYYWNAYTALTKHSANQVSELNGLVAQREETISTSTARIAELEGVLTETQGLLQEAVDENKNLSHDLKREKTRNDDFEDQISKIDSTVGKLDKLAKTDKELLMKYSKVYFLNEHYMPEKLSEIPKDYLYSETEPKFLASQVLPFFNDMLEDALTDGVELWVRSAFRSFDEQKDLKGAYTVAYGSGANTFSADQGYSEHQLGTTIDFTTRNLNGGLDGFDTTPAYAWLTENAYKYGFILSYPKENSYYIFEPWHWRFVGTDLAEELHDKGEHFYDLDQREIDTYLISIFD